MANINETNHWSEAIYEIATTDDVIGGADGISNIQATQLASRTNFLKEHVNVLETDVDNLEIHANNLQIHVGNLETGQTAAGQAIRLTTARSIGISGDATGSAGFDGTTDVIINLIQQDSGVGAGSYHQVIVDVKGRVVSGSNPTTLAGYGITDAASNYAPTITGQSVFYDAPSDTSAQVVVCGAGGAPGVEAKIRFYGTFASSPDNDMGQRLTASLRSGFDGGAWGSEYLDVWLNNTGNDAQSDTSQERIARFTPHGLDLGNKTISASTVVSTGMDSYRQKTGSTAAGYGTFWRNDGQRLWLLLTSKDDADGSYNALRPFSVNLETGMVEFCNGTLAVDQAGNAQVATPETADNSARIVNSSWVKTWVSGLGYAEGINNAMLAAHAAQAAADYASLPAGTRLPFAQQTAPTGWTQVNDDSTNNRMLRVVNGSSGSWGGVHDPLINNVVPAHTHRFTTGNISADHTHIIQDPGHSHGVTDPGHAHSITLYARASNGTGVSDSGDKITYTGGTQAAATGISLRAATTGIRNGGVTSNHTHSGATDNGSSQTSWQPRYTDMIICVKN